MAQKNEFYQQTSIFDIISVKNERTRKKLVLKCQKIANIASRLLEIKI